VLRDRSGAVRGYLQYASFDIPLLFRLLFGPSTDVVIVEPPPTTGFVARIACAIRKVPYIYFSADVSTSAAKGIGAGRFVVACIRSLERWTLQGARGVLAVSEGVRREVIELGADPRTVAVVGTGIDTEQFAMDGRTIDVDYPFLVYAGTMSEMQGAGIFVDAFARIAAKHPTAKLIMFGQGVEAEELRARAEAIGAGRVEFPGSVTGKELAPWLRGAHAGLASSRPGNGYAFAFATKALASLSCGTPVIYAGVGPLASLIEENSLGWPAAWKVADVAEAMDNALRVPPLPETRSRLADWAISNHSLKAVAARAVQAIQSVLD
jgi:glycosyltransferase involved in cell wall biosynthesis